uniref:Arginine/serine-rich splicing factor RSZ20 transcript V n=1 Tax=Zea mays TaxID=4577 RepID=M1HA90_MAIZE|nr:arginine/serine-rich splicing factor RSZ20 transcript V [Zea mays]
MARVYVGNLDSRVTSGELEDEFRVFGVLLKRLGQLRLSVSLHGFVPPFLARPYLQTNVNVPLLAAFDVSS